MDNRRDDIPEGQANFTPAETTNKNMTVLRRLRGKVPWVKQDKCNYKKDNSCKKKRGGMIRRGGTVKGARGQFRGRLFIRNYGIKAAVVGFLNTETGGGNKRGEHCPK